MYAVPENRPRYGSADIPMMILCVDKRRVDAVTAGGIIFMSMRYFDNLLEVFT